MKCQERAEHPSSSWPILILVYLCSLSIEHAWKIRFIDQIQCSFLNCKHRKIQGENDWNIESVILGMFINTLRALSHIMNKIPVQILQFQMRGKYESSQIHSSHMHNSCSTEYWTKLLVWEEEVEWNKTMPLFASVCATATQVSSCCCHWDLWKPSQKQPMCFKCSGYIIKVQFLLMHQTNLRYEVFNHSAILLKT